MDIKEQDILGPAIGRHWYYRNKACALSRYLRDSSFNTIVDVGAGSGFFSRHLLENTSATSALCVDPHYSSPAEETVAGKPMRFLPSAQGQNADLFLFMDVLEHVDDDVGLLREYMKPASSGSTAMITVPAFQFMWSGHDDFLEHKRRYTLGSLRATVENAGLTVVKDSYYFGFVFPLAMATRLAQRILPPGDSAPESQLKNHSPVVNGVLGALCSAELSLLNHNRLAGLSAFCLARKP